MVTTDMDMKYMLHKRNIYEKKNTTNIFMHTPTVLNAFYRIHAARGPRGVRFRLVSGLTDAEATLLSTKSLSFETNEMDAEFAIAPPLTASFRLPAQDRKKIKKHTQ